MGWWLHLKYYLLLATLVAAAFGVVVSGFVAAVPVLTRGFVFLVKPFQTAVERGWHQVPAMSQGQWFSIALFAGVFALCFLGPRFWCRCICPTGAIFSIASLLRITERKVTSNCVNCGKCVDTCSFVAVHGDFTTKPTDCTFCQTCGGVCPVGAVRFSWRWDRRDPVPIDETAGSEAAVERRGFLKAAVGLAMGAAGGVASAAAISNTKSSSGDSSGTPTVRPPGSVPEELFLRMCVRCGECLQACPNDVLQPSTFEQGLDGLWTPQVVADWSGCEPSCSNCGQVCPTGAIRSLPLEEKRSARMGLAVVDQQTCLPYAGHGECQLCVDECTTASYDAIEFVRVGTELDAEGQPIADSGFLAPVVLAGRCVGCGLCQARCYGMTVADKGLLTQSAIIVEAGDGKEDRLLSGSYIALREAEQRERERKQRSMLENDASDGGYLPDFLK
jgi:ferredoxin